MEVLQQVLRYTTQHTAGEVDTKTSYSCSKDDLAWLGAALEAVGKEESQRLGMSTCFHRHFPQKLTLSPRAAVHQQCLIDHLSKDTTEILQALEYMEDFVETYDSALGSYLLTALAEKYPQATCPSWQVGSKQEAATWCSNCCPVKSHKFSGRYALFCQHYCRITSQSRRHCSARQLARHCWVVSAACKTPAGLY